MTITERFNRTVNALEALHSELADIASEVIKNNPKKVENFTYLDLNYKTLDEIFINDDGDITFTYSTEESFYTDALDDFNNDDLIGIIEYFNQ